MNYFQPSFKLVEKTRDGARVTKRYDKPATPCDRLLEHGSVGVEVKDRLRENRARLDPVVLLHTIRQAQSALVAVTYEAEKNVYEVTVAATDSSGVNATVAVTITVTNVDLPGMANDYDADKNEAIDRDEALATVADYFSGVISKEEALAVVYFAG